MGSALDVPAEPVAGCQALLGALRAQALLGALRAPGTAARLVVAVAIGAAAVAAVSAHDVTTTVTWNREVTRIIYARCAGCHRPGGSAFSLLTFQEASPWATAIKNSVLRRTMPPWGAVKGFGTFRNEQALSQEELGLIEHWVNGGAPEGNPNNLPPRGRIAAPESGGAAAGALMVSAGHTFTRSFVLDGFRVAQPPTIADAQITIAFPDGRVAPLVWLRGYSATAPHPFLLRSALFIPPGAKMRGMPAGAVLELLRAAPTPAAR